MSDLIVKILTGLLRVALVPLTNWLVSHDIITSDETVKFIAEVAGWAVAIIWTVWAWIQAKRREHTSLAMAPGSTPNDVTAAMSAGKSAPAAVAPDVVPQLKP